MTQDLIDSMVKRGEIIRTIIHSHAAHVKIVASREVSGTDKSRT